MFIAKFKNLKNYCMKATARAHSNIAFVKYWGRKDEILRLPTNGSISMNLSNLFSTTTVEFSPALPEDDITINNIKDKTVNDKVSKHLDRIRTLSKVNSFAKVVSHNSFAASAGMASSASGFAALTLAGITSAGSKLSEKEVSILARQGSGSACRSIPNGFVEWLDGDTSNESYAKSIFNESYWAICDIVTIISKEKKDVATSVGQQRVDSSIFFQTRLENIKTKIEQCHKLIEMKDFENFGKLIEMEALELHSIMLTSWPSLIYLEPESLIVMKLVHQLRAEGILVYFTIDAGPNIHVICLQKDSDLINKKLLNLSGVKETIINMPSKGTYLVEESLF